MIRQYLEIKQAHQDCILFFRLGDFYEMFFEDAKTASAILNIALTSRGKTEGKKVPMCGIPFHSAQGYVQKLLDAGKKIAICEQVSDPALSKGIVERKVVRLITPALRPDDLKSKHHSYLASVALQKDAIYGLAYLDLATGQFRATVLKDQQKFLDELWRIAPKELLWPADAKEQRIVRILKTIFPALLINFVGRAEPAAEPSAKPAAEPSRDLHLDAPLNDACQMIFHYLKRAQYISAEHIQNIDVYETVKHLQLGSVTVRNLEILETQYEHCYRGSLLWLLDQCATAMGSRLLRQWLLYPLMDVDQIKKRQAAIQPLFEKPSLRVQLQDHLKQILDIERIIGRLALGLATARDLVALRQAFDGVPQLNGLLETLGRKALDSFDDLRRLLTQAIVEDPPLSVKSGGMIRQGYDAGLDELIHLCRDGKTYLANLEKQERARTGIGSLKVRYNQVFGYYIEVTNVHLNRVPETYIRKQTLANAERFITPELKTFEYKILSAEEKRHALEYEIFENLRKKALEQISLILKFSRQLAVLDVFCALAQVSSDNHYVLPQFTADGSLRIIEGRHPVIEALSQERFVPNDMYMDNTRDQLLILTGPNMAGKSTIMRQTALIVLLAQIGCFVPAKEAAVPIVDHIFTRVGAQDNLSQGDSTFMVEMRETAFILRSATPKSLILLDEIGRGTATFDGMSIAWAVATYIHDRIGAKTLFATHYHELTYLAEEKERVKNFHVAVRKINDEIVFLRKLLPGGMQRSYGIEVARLAGVPEVVISDAQGLLTRLEKEQISMGKGVKRPLKQLSHFQDQLSFD